MLQALAHLETTDQCSVTHVPSRFFNHNCEKLEARETRLQKSLYLQLPAQDKVGCSLDYIRLIEGVG